MKETVSAIIQRIRRLSTLEQLRAGGLAQELVRAELERMRDHSQDWKRIVDNLNNELRKHNEFGSLFQIGGRFYREAHLPIGSSCVVEGGKWLVAENDQLRKDLAKLRELLTVNTHGRTSY